MLCTSSWRVGRLAIVGGNERVNQEVPPFAAVSERGLLGYNAIGCKRRYEPRIDSCRPQLVPRHPSAPARQHVLEEIEAKIERTVEILELLDFIRHAKRGIVPSVGGRRMVFEDFGYD